MRYFPLFFDLVGQNVLVVGAGNVAERKIRLLLRAGAIPAVVARELNETVRDWVKSGRVRWLASVFDERQIDSQRLVFAATSDPGLNRAVFLAAEARSVPVNVVDDRAQCRFVSPAVVDRGLIQIAISTGGSSPVLARTLRSLIETLLPSGLGRVAEAAQRLRGAVARQLSLAARRRLWESLLAMPNLVRWSSMPASQIEAGMGLALQGAARAGCRRERLGGHVFLVGAGPGQPDLLTLRAMQVLGQADVILFDHLVAESILELGRRDADRIYVGKRAGVSHHSQEDIQQRMIAEARQGRIVVRLKGGDPFVFGRGGEELEALQRAGIECEVVPGITAAIGCAAFAGIPLTHRDFAHTLTLVTGHRAKAGQGIEPPAIDWAGISGPGRTVVVYMGVRQAAMIRQELLDSGLDSNFPVALVIDGTRETQQVLTGTITTLPELAAAVPAGSPGLLIIGQAATWQSNLSCSPEKPTVKAAA